jgi:serine/threonine protein kinase
VTATILRRTYAVKEEDLAQFARKMGALTSPRISRVLDFNRYRNRTYMLTEYFDGPLLQDRLSDRTPLPYLESLQIAKQIAEALADGHRLGLPHLNLQPANILITSDGAKLVNYGFTRLKPYSRDSGRLPNADSYDYLSPEQLARKGGGESSDIYALGTILYEMLTGHTPGVGKFKQASEENIQVTEAIDVLIDHARELFPEKRYTMVSEMGAEINRIALTSLRGQPNQYIRVGLAWVSRFYRSLISKKFIFFTLVVLAGSLALSTISAISPVLNAAARLILPMLFNSLLVSILVDWAVRAIAKWKGLGSLTTSGRGIGALFGLVFTINFISVAGFQEFFQDPEILSFFAAMLSIVLFETTLGFGIVLGAAWTAERFFNSFTSGFYWSFVVIMLLELILTILHQPKGLIW